MALPSPISVMPTVHQKHAPPARWVALTDKKDLPAPLRLVGLATWSARRKLADLYGHYRDPKTVATVVIIGTAIRTCAVDGGRVVTTRLRHQPDNGKPGRRYRGSAIIDHPKTANRFANQAKAEEPDWTK